MIIVLEMLLLLLALSGVVALFFRVRCPPDHALVLTDRADHPSLRSGPPSFRVLPEQGAFRLPSTGAVDLLEIGSMRFDAFVPIGDSDGQRAELHALAAVRIARRPIHLRRAAVRLLGVSRKDLDAIGEGAIGVAVRNAIAGHGLRAIETDEATIVQDIRSELVTVFDELGFELTDLALRIKHREK